MSKHTPGPWQALPEECDRPYIRIRGTQLGGRYKVANVLTPVYEGVPKHEADETRANARLIAGAPDLLEALQDITERYAGDMFGVEHMRPEIAAARAAIAKATSA